MFDLACACFAGAAVAAPGGDGEQREARGCSDECSLHGALSLYIVCSGNRTGMSGSDVKFCPESVDWRGADRSRSGGHLRIGELSRRVGRQRRSCCAHGSAATDCSRRPARRAASGSTATPTSDACGACWLTSIRRLGGRGRATRAAASAEARRAGDAPANTAPGALARAAAPALDLFDERLRTPPSTELLVDFTLETVLRDAVLPYLRELGERWERGEASIAAGALRELLLRGRLLGLARGWGSVASPLALLACAARRAARPRADLLRARPARPGLAHRVPRAGHTARTRSRETARQLGPALVVLTATTPGFAGRGRAELAEVAGSAPLALAGAGMGAKLAEAVGAAYLEDDPVDRGEPSSRAGSSGPMARPDLTGWSSTERMSRDGAVQFEQLVTSSRPLVELLEAGALALAERYWREVELHDPPPRPRAPARRRDRAASARPLDAAPLRSTADGGRRRRASSAASRSPAARSPARRAARSRSRRRRAGRRAARDDRRLLPAPRRRPGAPPGRARSTGTCSSASTRASAAATSGG